MKKDHAFKIVAAGEDFAAVMLAQELSKRLAAKLKSEFEIEISSDAWKFEALDNPQTSKVAAEKAAKADMVIIAASGAGEPPALIKRWIESWLHRKRKRVTALVALCDYEHQTPHESPPLCVYLRRIAGKWGMDFLTNSAEEWKDNFEFCAETSTLPKKYPARNSQSLSFQLRLAGRAPNE